MTPDEEKTLFRQTAELEARALELVLSIPEERRGSLAVRGKTAGPIRERVREILLRLREDPCPISRRAAALIAEADELYWGMVLQWDRLALKEAWGGSSLPGDAAQEGRCGLYRACLRFDVDKGFRFSTYARNWLRQSVRRFENEEVPAIKIPRGQQEIRGKLLRAQQHLWSTSQREASLKEAADWLGMGGYELEMALEAPTYCGVSIDTPVGDSDITLGDLLETSSANPLELFEGFEHTETIAILFQVLDERERHIITERYLAPDPKNFRQIGDGLGLSRERVRQIILRAFKKLQDPQIIAEGRVLTRKARRTMDRLSVDEAIKTGPVGDGVAQCRWPGCDNKPYSRGMCSTCGKRARSAVLYERFALPRKRRGGGVAPKRVPPLVPVNGQTGTAALLSAAALQKDKLQEGLRQRGREIKKLQVAQEADLAEVAKVEKTLEFLKGL